VDGPDIARRRHRLISNQCGGPQMRYGAASIGNQPGFLIAKEITVSSLLKWAFVFLVISLIAALFGFGGVASGAAGIAKVLFFIFLAVCLVLFALGVTVYKSVT
jgi:uncharacterized membrane protein YtjA (UPF0391 family)